MWTVAFRDVDDVPALQGPMSEFQKFIVAIAKDLSRAFGSGRPIKAAHSTIEHALYFPTWLHLDQLGLTDQAKLELVSEWLAGALKGR